MIEGERISFVEYVLAKPDTETSLAIKYPMNHSEIHCLQQKTWILTSNIAYPLRRYELRHPSNSPSDAYEFANPANAWEAPPNLAPSQYLPVTKLITSVYHAMYLRAAHLEYVRRSGAIVAQLYLSQSTGDPIEPKSSNQLRKKRSHGKQYRKTPAPLPQFHK